MGSIKLHMEPITGTIKNVTQSISQINANFVQSILILVTICCNSTKAYEMLVETIWATKELMELTNATDGKEKHA